MPIPVGIALGSNLGDRQAELDAGIAFLRTLAVNGLVRESTRIETEPIDCPPGSNSFLNAVAEIEIDPAVLSPLELLSRLQEFERHRGRPREHVRNSPRPLDLDLIFYGEMALQTPELTIPHPRAIERRFVLEPLAQLRPNLVLPGQSKTVWRLLAAQPGGT